MTETQRNGPQIDRHSFVSHCLSAGWRITSAARDHLIFEGSNQWQMTGWFGNGMVGLIELYDAETGEDFRFQPNATMYTPSDIMEFVQATISAREQDQ